jgi:hypothetical protein
MSYSIDAFENCTSYEEEYFVEKILDKRKYKDVWKYKVKWVGYSIDDCTWEPIENLEQCRDLVDKFENERESKLIKSPEKSADSQLKKKKKESTNTSTTKEEEQLKPIIKKRRIEDEESDIDKTHSKLSNPQLINSQKSEEKEVQDNENPKLFKKNTEENSILEDATNSPISKSTAENDEKIICEIPGNFEEDIAEIISLAKIINTEHFELNCLVQWKKRENGIQPEATWISSKEIYEKDPRLLIRFYQTKIKLPAP